MRERRKSRVSDAKDTAPVEYLYNGRGVKFQIVKKTTKRIYYIRATDEREPLFYRIKNPVRHIDRQKIVRDGEIWRRRDRGLDDSPLYLKPPTLRHSIKPLADIRELKAAMAAAHPDAGGSNEQFIAARKAYVAAKKPRKFIVEVRR